jgi:uncharacterized protein
MWVPRIINSAEPSTMSVDSPAIVHDAAAGRFETLVDGELCVANYRLFGKTMMLVHTGVPHALRGRGIAAVLVAAALRHARERGWRVRPDCSYAEAYMQRHPETLDLLHDA